MHYFPRRNNSIDNSLVNRNDGSKKTMNTIFKLQTEKKMSAQNSISTKKSFKNEFEIDISIQKLRKCAVSRSALKEILKRVLQVGGT